MNIAGAVEQHVKPPNFGGTFCNVLLGEDIQLAYSYVGPIMTNGGKGFLVDVSSPHHRSFVGKCDGGGASNALSRCRNQRNLSRKSSAHSRGFLNHFPFIKAV